MAPGFRLGCESRGTENKPVQKQSRLWNVLDTPVLLGRRRTLQLQKKSGPDGRPPAGGSHQLRANPFSAPTHRRVRSEAPAAEAAHAKRWELDVVSVN